MTDMTPEAQLQNRLKTTSTTFTWEIGDIWNLTFDGVSSLNVFLSDHALYLQARRYETSIAIYLGRRGTTTDVLRILSKLWLIDRLGQKRFLGEKEVVSDKPKGNVLLESLSISVLQMKKTDILQGNDILTLSCSLSTSYRLNLMQKCETGTDRSILCLGTLSSDLEKLYNTKQDCDVVLKVENIEFHAHRTILSARSSKFNSMFNTTVLKENFECPPCIKATIFSEVLYYIYTGKIHELVSETAVPLYAAAEIYSLTELRDICRNFLRLSLTAENVLEVIDTAYTHDDQPLKEEVQNFIVKNVAEIMTSDGWKDFRIHQCVIANQILTDVLLKRCAT